MADEYTRFKAIAERDSPQELQHYLETEQLHYFACGYYNKILNSCILDDRTQTRVSRIDVLIQHDAINCMKLIHKHASRTRFDSRALDTSRCVYCLYNNLALVVEAIRHMARNITTWFKEVYDIYQIRLALATTGTTLGGHGILSILTGNLSALQFLNQEVGIEQVLLIPRMTFIKSKYPPGEYEHKRWGVLSTHYNTNLYLLESVSKDIARSLITSTLCPESGNAFNRAFSQIKVVVELRRMIELYRAYVPEKEALLHRNINGHTILTGRCAYPKDIKCFEYVLELVGNELINVSYLHQSIDQAGNTRKYARTPILIFLSHLWRIGKKFEHGDAETTLQYIQLLIEYGAICPKVNVNDYLISAEQRNKLEQMTTPVFTKSV